MRLKPRFTPASRHPLDPRAVFVLGLAVVSGVPLLFGAVEPGSVEVLMPGWGVFLWGLGLVVGCLMTLIGMSRQSIDGIIVEQIGSVMTGMAALIYGAAVVLVGGRDSLVGASFIVGFGVACLWRWGQLQESIREGQVIVEAQKTREESEQ